MFKYCTSALVTMVFSTSLTVGNSWLHRQWILLPGLLIYPTPFYIPNMACGQISTQPFQTEIPYKLHFFVRVLKGFHCLRDLWATSISVVLLISLTICLRHAVKNLQFTMLLTFLITCYSWRCFSFVTEVNKRNIIICRGLWIVSVH